MATIDTKVGGKQRTWTSWHKFTGLQRARNVEIIPDFIERMTMTSNGDNAFMALH